MKKRLIALCGAVAFFALCVPAFSQPSSKSVATFDIDTFDSVGSQSYKYNGEDITWEWGVNASRFVAEGYPKLDYFDGMPNSLKILYKGSEEEHKALGVKVAFNRKGDNWFEIFPTKDGKPYEIPFIGTVSSVDFWVWGANYLYYLEILVRDSDGRVHVFPACNLAFNGWKNVVVGIPGWMSQHSRMRNGRPDATFVGFRVRSDAEEFVDNFVIFLDHFKYTTNSLSNIFDGYELKDVDFGDSESGGSSSSGSSSQQEAK